MVWARRIKRAEFDTRDVVSQACVGGRRVVVGGGEGKGRIRNRGVVWMVGRVYTICMAWTGWRDGVASGVRWFWGRIKGFAACRLAPDSAAETEGDEQWAVKHVGEGIDKRLAGDEGIQKELER